MVKDLRIDDFDYELPEERIARYPLADRDNCKLLVRQADGTLSQHVFTELPSLLSSDSILVYNNTRVINARLRFRKASGAIIEVFCLEPAEPRDYAVSFAQTSSCSWTCFVGNSKRWKEGKLSMQLMTGTKTLTFTAERLSKDGNSSVVAFSWDNPEVTFSEIISAVGEIPIPPYLNRHTEASDSTDYQTVYSHIDGSVAAPTAGLHFTGRVLEEISRKGIPRRELTLHVGAGTFQPVKSDEIGDHQMHSEFIAVPKTLIKELADTDRRVIAVGTTSVRTLESLYHAGKLIANGNWDGEVPQWAPYADTTEEYSADISVCDALNAISAYLDNRGEDTFIASTRIIIAPGYRYRIVKGMVTNFHQPRSTLLLLVSAFTGGDWRPIYDYALANSFRFLSYGDACLLL